MDRRAAASLKAICNSLPLNHSNVKLLYMAAFGSQIRGTYRPDSDLDILYVTDVWSFEFGVAIKRTGRQTPGGMHDINTFSYSYGDIQRHANLYGAPMYGVLRGIDSRTIYRDVHFNPALADPDTHWCAGEWLRIADIHLGRAATDDCGLSCFHASLVIDYSIRAYLLHHGIRFPHTRDIRILYDMRPPPIQLDLDAVNHWRDYIKHPDNHYSEDDMCTAIKTAKRTRDTVWNVVHAK